MPLKIEVFPMKKQQSKSELIVSAIKNGTVIDHVQPERLYDIIGILGLDKLDKQITVGNYLESHRLGKKAIIKISDKFLDEHEVNKIALLSPKARISVIKDYEVCEKRDVNLPQQIIGTVKCINARCITNHEIMQPRYNVLSKDPVLLSCDYCGREISAERIIII